MNVPLSFFDAFSLPHLAPLGEWLEGVLRSLRAFWNLQIVTIEEKHVVTVSNLVIALTVVIVGYLAARWVSSFLRNKILNHFRLGEGAASATQTILFYILMIFVVLFALNFANIPLTIFAVIGGAIALGVGFGSQTIVNNFISGLIILFERPIKVGDLIDVGGTFGLVEHIGARSTRVRTTDNTHIIIPNSAFVEKSVLNWTLSDQRIRTSINVGVAYGSPTDQVAELIEQAVALHEKTLNNPKPVVLFREFGDNALHFEVLFWIMIRRVLERQMIESDIRFEIDRSFRKEGIVIAFPQRDIHLDTLKPLEVHVRRDSHA